MFAQQPNSVRPCRVEQNLLLGVAAQGHAKHDVQQGILRRMHLPDHAGQHRLYHCKECHLETHDKTIKHAF